MQKKRQRWSFAAGMILVMSAVAFSGQAQQKPMHDTSGARDAASLRADAPDLSDTGCMLHHGQVNATQDHRFETVFTNDGVKVFMYGDDQTPERFGAAHGTMTVRYKDGRTTEVPLAVDETSGHTRTVYYCPAHPSSTRLSPGKCPRCGADLVAQNALAGMIDMKGVAPGTMTASFSLDGLGGDESSAAFTETFRGMHGAGMRRAMSNRRRGGGMVGLTPARPVKEKGGK